MLYDFILKISNDGKAICFVRDMRNWQTVARYHIIDISTAEEECYIIYKQGESWVHYSGCIVHACKFCQKHFNKNLMR